MTSVKKRYFRTSLTACFGPRHQAASLAGDSLCAQEPLLRQRASQVPSAKQLLSQLPVFSQKDRETASKVLTCMLDRYDYLITLCPHLQSSTFVAHELPLLVSSFIDAHNRLLWRDKTCRART